MMSGLRAEDEDAVTASSHSNKKFTFGEWNPKNE